MAFNAEAIQKRVQISTNQDQEILNRSSLSIEATTPVLTRSYSGLGLAELALHC